MVLLGLYLYPHMWHDNLLKTDFAMNMAKEWNFLYALDIIEWKICNYQLTRVNK